MTCEREKKLASFNVQFITLVYNVLLSQKKTAGTGKSTKVPVSAPLLDCLDSTPTVKR